MYTVYIFRSHECALYVAVQRRRLRYVHGMHVYVRTVFGYNSVADKFVIQALNRD